MVNLQLDMVNFAEDVSPFIICDVGIYWKKLWNFLQTTQKLDHDSEGFFFFFPALDNNKMIYSSFLSFTCWFRE